jgi:hypothetical protein
MHIFRFDLSPRDCAPAGHAFAPHAVRSLYFFFGATAVLGLLARSSPALAGERSAHAAALESIKAADSKRYVDALADDSFEGRQAGTRGGQAAGIYLAREFQRHKLKPAGGDGTYFQQFFGNCRNVLGVLEGSDPVLRQQYILVGAHYDHVGYGSRSNSNGPIGFIHNGADDNASGVAGLLETIEAFATLPSPPKRSILFAYWDSEENGLNGSKHWVQNPTIPLQQISAAINLDMIGRLRNDQVHVYGTRTSAGLRRLVSQANRDVNLLLDFTWEMSGDSDHHTFFLAGIPVIMFHTGLHDDYHRPSDDAPKINNDGIERISRLLFNSTAALADETQQNRFRPQSRSETQSTRQAQEQALAPLPGRLGVRWLPAKNDGAQKAGVQLESVTPGSAAARGGLRPGDRIVRFAGHEVDHDQFASLVLAAANPVEAVVERTGTPEPLTIKLQLAGQPVRMGITWRIDDAEPSLVQIVRVVPGSPAASAGINLFDRVYEVNGQRFASGDEYARLVAASEGPLQLLVETHGRMRTIRVEPPKRLEPVGAE